MVRTIIKPDAPRINLSIPAEYIGKEVEILVFPVKGNDVAARAVPVFGCLQGQIQMSADFDEPLDDFKDYI